jgi:hypothetical protein
MFGGGSPEEGEPAVFDAAGNVVPASAVLGGGSGVTLKSKTGTFSTSGQHTIVSAVPSKKIRVVSYSVTMIGTALTNVIFQTGSNPVADLWSLVLQSPSSVSVGANLSTTSPYYLFGTGTGEALLLTTDQAHTVRWAVTYYEA